MFDPMEQREIEFMNGFKTGELIADPGTQILEEGRSSTQLFTALSGMGLRYKTAQDGKRQVVGFVLPGDFVGLQSGVMGEMQHSVEATTTMTLCVFNRADFWDLFKSQPERAFALTHLAAREEQFLGEALTTVGQMNGVARVAWAIYKFYQRLDAVQLVKNGRVPLPYRQQDLADAVGLSLVHTNKTLSRLREAGVASWQDDGLVVRKENELARLAGVEPGRASLRPLI